MQEWGHLYAQATERGCLYTEGTEWRRLYAQENKVGALMRSRNRVEDICESKIHNGDICTRDQHIGEWGHLKTLDTADTGGMWSSSEESDSLKKREITITCVNVPWIQILEPFWMNYWAENFCVDSFLCDSQRTKIYSHQETNNILANFYFGDAFSSICTGGLPLSPALA